MSISPSPEALAQRHVVVTLPLFLSLLLSGERFSDPGYLQQLSVVLAGAVQIGDSSVALAAHHGE
ncbi:hypothetical protein [Salinicola endophyticus]|uniref:AraC family transcriptional regulator n=1 Tax=Salinicola endophyticus TaxID=1949083 RepID=A0AB74U2G7_9GAMM